MTYTFGWQRDLPDVRDITDNHEKITNVLKVAPPLKLTSAVDLRQWCSPIEDQKSIGSCTANSGVGMLEYFENKAFGKFTNASRLFLYKATRNLMKITGDTGATLRLTMKAMVLFGIPPEEYFPYDVTKFDVEPSAFHYAFADNFKSISYYKLDPPGTTPAQTLQNIKEKLMMGLPSMFGFTVYSSLSNSALIPFPGPRDTVKGGHAVMAVGFEDNKVIGNCTGALLIRNSWGTTWGQCFTGDTKIALLNGENVSLKELSESSEKEFWVYSYDISRNKIVPGLAKNCHLTKRNTQIIKVILDNGAEIKCTPDHKFLMRNGQYKQARLLKQNDSLMPLYKSYDKDGYEKIANHSNCSWTRTHKVVASECNLLNNQENMVIHHIDFNKLNNSPNNLAIIETNDHLSLHGKLNAEKTSIIMKNYWNENYDKQINVSIDHINKYNEDLKNGIKQLTCSQIEARRQNMIRLNTGGTSDSRKEKTKKAIQTKMEKYGSMSFKGIGIYERTPEMLEQSRKMCSNLSKYRSYKKNEEEPMSYKEWESVYNHKVIRIEDAGFDDVYDMTVDKYHNFALSDGIFVHNSGYGWLPYQYVLSGLAVDFWSLVKADYVDSDLFA